MPTPPATAMLDSMRGFLTVTGSEPAVQLVLREPEDRRCLVTDASASGLRAAQGLEITVWGPRDTTAATPMLGVVRCSIAVTRFAVRSAEGVSAVDGVLCRSDSGLALQLADGAVRALAAVPSALQSQIGARIFWAGPLDRAPASYGVLVGSRGAGPRCGE